MKKWNKQLFSKRINIATQEILFKQYLTTLVTGTTN